MGRPSKGQQDWLDDKQKARTLEDFGDWSRKRGISDANRAAQEFVDEWESALAAGPTAINFTFGQQELLNAIKGKIPKINKFGINARKDFTAEVENKLIQRLNIQGGNKLKLRNCTIKEIDCRETERASSSLVLINCWVGYLRIGSRSLNYFEMRGGGVRRLRTPLPNEDNPFVGSVTVAPSVAFSPDLENAQAFRNLRHHLMAMHNQEAASVFHSAEMRTLFKQQSRLDKVFNVLYRGISDYGNSTGRPLIWFSIFALINFMVMVLSNGAVSTSQVEGWQRALLTTDCTGNILRSATITFIQILNPLGVFGLRHLVVAKSMPLAASNAILCFAATVSLGFFIFALRRRFRLAAD